MVYLFIRALVSILILRHLVNPSLLKTHKNGNKNCIKLTFKYINLKVITDFLRTFKLLVESIQSYLNEVV